MLIRNTLLYMPAQILGPLAQFAGILVFTHWMAPGPYGVFTYVIASQEFVFLLCLSWFSQYTIRYFSSHEAGDDDHYRESEFTILLATILPQAAAALLALRLIAVELSPALIAATVLYIVTRCLGLHLGERARAQSRILDYTVATSAGSLAGFVLAFVAVATISATPEAALAGYGIAQAVALAWLVARQNMRVRVVRPDRVLLGRAFRFGIPLVVAGIAAWIGMNAIRLMVDHALGPAAMGLIAVGWALGQRITTTAAMFVTTAAFPLAVERFRVGARDEAYRQITTNGLLMLGIALPSAVGLYLLQDALVALLVAAPFREMTIAVLPAALVAGFCRNVRSHVADQVFVLIENTTMVCVMTIVEGAMVVIGCWIGLILHGPVGAAYGSAAGYALTMVASFVVARMRAGLELPFVEATLVAAAVAIMAMVVHFLPGRHMLLGGAITRIVLVTCVGAAAYAAAILAFFPVIARSVRTRWRQSATR